jgi:ribosome recycling factor
MPVDEILMECEMHMEKSVEHLKHELSGIRTGRASPGLVDHVMVDYFGTPTPMKSIASITIPEATQIMIKPFSPGDMRAIEKAINDSRLGLTAQSDGKALRLKLPPLSQERRQQLAGQCKSFGEHTKIALRNTRRDANKHIETEQKAGDITEDEAEKAKEEVQELTKKYEQKVEEMLEHKRKEVMEV